MEYTEPTDEKVVAKFVSDPRIQSMALTAIQKSNGGKLESHNFRVGEAYLDWLRDYVYHKRTNGDSSYSQTRALHKAIDLLKQAEPGVLPRPENIRAQERKRNSIIANSIKTTKNKKDI